MSEDSLIKKLRQGRANSSTIQPRTDSLFSSTTPSLPLETKENTSSDRITEIKEQIAQLKKEINNSPKQHRFINVTTEKNTGEAITAFAKKNKVGINSLIEALWLAVNTDDELLGMVNKIAKERNKQRKSIGEKRKTLTRRKNELKTLQG